MKELILILFTSLAILSCSNDKSSDNPSNSNGLLVKTVMNGSSTLTYNYNGNKATYISSSDGTTHTYTYNRDLIIKEESTGGSGSNYSHTMNYSNNFLTSSTKNINSTSSSLTFNSTYIYNSDGSITEIKTDTPTYSGNTTSLTYKYIRFYSQGNCIKKESYSPPINGVMTLNGAITYTYDSFNFPFKNVTGLCAYTNPEGFFNNNNRISETHKNATGVITKTIQTTYQYNSQGYPISKTSTSKNYTINPQTGASTPGIPVTSSETITYY